MAAGPGTIVPVPGVTERIALRVAHAPSRSRDSARWMLFALVTGVIAYLVLGPFWYLVRETFFVSGRLDLSAFERVIRAPRAGSMLWRSAVFAVSSTLVATALGTALAYLHVRTDAPFKRLALAGSIVPLVMPGVLYAMAWVFVGSRSIGIVGKILADHVPVSVPDVFSLPGMILVEGLHLSPIAFLLVIASLRSMDPSLEESAVMCGARRSAVLKRITLPLLRPALLATSLIVFVLALESFDIPALLGFPSGNHVFSTRLYFLTRQTPPDLAGAGAISTFMLVIALTGVVLSNRLGRNAQRFATVTGKAFRPRPILLGRYRPVVGAGMAVYYGVTVLLPVGALVYASLLPFYRVPSRDVFGAFTIENYRNVLDEDGVRAWRNSLLLAVGAGSIVVLLAAVAAWIVVRSRIPARGLLDHLSTLPLVFPGLVLGLGISFVYLRLPVSIYGTLTILLIAYCTKFLPYGMRFAVSSMHQVANELEESAAMCGATWLTTFRRIVVPLVVPGLLSAFIFVLIASFRELSTSLLLYSPDTEVLGVRLFAQFNEGRFVQAAALGCSIVIVLVVLAVVTNTLGRRWGVRVES